MQASDCCLAIESFGVAIRLDWVNRGKTDDSDGGSGRALKALYRSKNAEFVRCKPFFLHTEQVQNYYT